MNLTVRDRYIILALIVILTCYGVYKMVWLPTNSQIANLKVEKTEAEALAGDISPLLEKSKELEQMKKELSLRTDEIKQTVSKMTATKEEFLVFLGNSSVENKVQVISFDDLGTTSEDGIFKAMFDFELRGSSEGIVNVINDINSMGVQCSFGSISYRQNEEYVYLKRFFDDITSLPWYEEPEKTEEEDDGKNEEDIEEKEEHIPEETIDPSLPTIISPPDSAVIPDTPKLPEQTPPPVTEETLPPNEEPKSLEDRLDDLLSQTSYKASTAGYKVVFLTNTQTNNLDIMDNGSFVSSNNNEMRLAVTVCLVMFNEPSFETSILNENEAKETNDGIL
jgi:hypothetical protein